MKKCLLTRLSMISALLVLAMTTPINAEMCTEVASELQYAVHENMITWEQYDSILGRCDGIVEAESLPK